MLIGEYFRTIREAKGLSKEQLAAAVSPDFEPSLLLDFEAGDDDDIDGWSLEEFKRYCATLGAVPTDLADIPVQDIEHLSLHQMIRKRREEKGYSLSYLSDLIGFEEAVIEALEGADSYRNVCVHALKEIALYLDIPLWLLLAKL